MTTKLLDSIVKLAVQMRKQYPAISRVEALSKAIQSSGFRDLRDFMKTSHVIDILQALAPVFGVNVSSEATEVSLVKRFAKVVYDEQASSFQESLDCICSLLGMDYHNFLVLPKKPNPT